ncbi:integrase catalytic subunit [Ferriphaselus amnicola]|uniref:Integrase catalytic subunit n=1 Tax=Ferriphaselus amnicola TaxID=1188319 RepID=A0A2Z6GCK5_9PROT|nr:Mu transposase C-terminal domain-containing protein [Ferriphaselus amnicola]BBE51180.1 integrase catalytic subunit [Ferriphaselus amnicola]
MQTLATVTSSELRAALGWSAQQFQRFTTRPEWPAAQARTGRGGEKRWAIAELPATLTIKGKVVKVREVVQRFKIGTVVHAAVVAAPAPIASTEVAEVRPDRLAELTQKQRDVHGAIDQIVRFVNEYCGSLDAAIATLNTGYALGTLSAGLRWSYEHCWFKPRPGSSLTRSTYHKWLANFKVRGHYAPMQREKDFSIKPWHAAAIVLRQRPQGSQLSWISAQLNEQFGENAPSYDALRRFLTEKFSQKDQLKGRYTGSKLRSHLFYQHRTAEGLAPADEVHADGWNSHFTAPHPVTGEFVTYEIWHFHDVATRYVTTPGIGLTENAEVIAKGLENVIRELGIPVHLQTDSTKVVRGSERFTKAMNSLEERLGFTWVHPQEVGNSQANGIPENFNTSYLDKRSRELATYQNKNSMDDLTFKRVKKLTGEMVKAAKEGDSALWLAKKKEATRMGKGLVFESYDQAVDWILLIHDEYNDRPHRALPRVRDTGTGKMRHQTPRESLNEHRANGWSPIELSEAELIDAFRPHVIVKVTRETVSPYGGMRYRNTEVLGHWNGKQVIVAYDIADYSQVWVKGMDGTLICEAKFVESTGYRTDTAKNMGEEKRMLATLRRLDKKRDQVLERAGVKVIEHQDLKPVQFPEIEREPELIPVEFAPIEPVREMSWDDTCKMLWGTPPPEESGDDTPNKVAAR